MADLRTVGDLLDYLSKQPRDRKIVLSKDAEGNGFSPLADASEGMYKADSTYSGDMFPTPEQAEVLVREQDFDPEDLRAPGGAERVVVIGPVN